MTKAILFDFDGTIANTAPGIVATMKATFERMGKPIPTEEEMVQTIGIPLRLALKQLNNLSDEEAQTAVDIYCELFKVIEVAYTSLFNKVNETLETLAGQGMRMAIVTSRNKESLDVIMTRFGIDGYFELVFTNNNNFAPKPAPDMVIHALKEMSLTADEAIVVGDTTYDILMGNRAGCKTIAVTYGNHSREQIQEAEPTIIIDEFEEILRNI